MVEDLYRILEGGCGGVRRQIGSVGNEGGRVEWCRGCEIANKMEIWMKEDNRRWVEFQETDKTAGEKDEVVSGRYGLHAEKMDGVLVPVRGAIGLP